MTKKQINNTLGIALVCLCIAGGIWGIVRQKRLKKDHTIGIAYVTDCSSGGRGNAGGIWIDYILYAEGKKYKGSSLYLTSDFDVGDVADHMLYKTFPAAYNPGNPSISSLMILPKDFTRYGYQFPDSLKWVLQYVKK
jgi:hypothetical protein